MLAAVRQFFGQRGYLEVETPCLSRDVVVDAWLEPLRLRQSDGDWYLQTSPEAFMKRLLPPVPGRYFRSAACFVAASLGRGTTRNSRCWSGMASERTGVSRCS